MLIIRLLMILVLFWTCYFLVGAFDGRGRSIADFNRVRLTSHSSHLKETYLRSRSVRIEIEAEGKTYKLTSHAELTPISIGFDDVVPLLNRSTELVLWVDESEGEHWVRGVQADGTMIISPMQGLRFHERERLFALWGAVGFFVLGLTGYVYFRKVYRLDWKLGHSHSVNID